MKFMDYSEKKKYATKSFLCNKYFWNKFYSFNKTQKWRTMLQVLRDGLTNLIYKWDCEKKDILTYPHLKNFRIVQEIKKLFRFYISGCTYFIQVYKYEIILPRVPRLNCSLLAKTFHPRISSLLTKRDNDNLRSAMPNREILPKDLNQ